MTKTDIVLFAKALADDTRQKIMKLCCCEWISVNEIVEQLGGVSQPTVSHHLAILREIGLVDVQVTPVALDKGMVDEVVNDLQGQIDLSQFPAEQIYQAVFSARITARRP